MKKMHRRNWLHIGIWLILSVMLIMCINPIEGEAASATAQITSCTINASGSKVVVKANVSNKTKKMGKNLYIIEVEPFEKVGKSYTRKPVASTKSKNGKVTFSILLNSESSKSSRFSKFVVAYKSGKKYQVISDARYITNPQKMATFSENYPVTYSKKGLQVGLMQDSLDLGTQHTVLNWVLNDVVAAPGTGEAYYYRGQNYYFNSDVLNSYDNMVRQYNEAGSKVTIILLLKNVNDPNLNALRFQGGSALYSSIRTSSKASCRQFEAIMSYLGQRYGQRSHLVSGWILGNEIDNPKDWNYGGGKSLSAYMDGYAQAFRICNTAVQSVNKNAHVYLSLDYYWTRDTDGKGKNAFAGKDILNTFYNKLSSTGLVDWYIAYHAYPEGLLLPEFWDDALATNSENSEIMNFKNMDVLTKYIKKNFGKNVKVMFSEQSFTDSHSQKKQAAAYAYAYYKCEANSMVEAFIYGRHVDNVEEVDPRTNGPIPWGLRDQNLNKRMIWDVFMYIDSPDGFKWTNKLITKIKGLKSWTSISGLDKKKFSKMPSKRSQVSGLNISTVSYNSVNLSWNHDAYATGYEVYRAVAGTSNYQLVASISDSNTTSYTDNGLGTGVTYTYKVRAYHRIAIANPIYGSYATANVTVAVGPTEIMSATAGAESVNLTWTQVKQASGYYVYRSDSENGNYAYVATVTGGNTVTYTDAHLQPGKTYYYKLIAFVQTANQTLTSTESSVKSAAPLPQKAILTTIIPGVNKKTGYSNLTLQWNPVPNASGYKVYMSESKDGPYTKVYGLADATATSYPRDIIRAAQLGKNLYFKICAYTTVSSTGENKYGDFSDVMYVKAYTNAPGITTAIRDADKNAVVSWNRIREADAYQVWRCNTIDGTYVQMGEDIIQTDSLTYSYKDTTATAAGTWFYKIRIVEKMGKNGDENNADKIPLYGEFLDAVQLPITTEPSSSMDTTGTTGTKTNNTDAGNTENPANTEQPTGQSTEQPTESSTKNSTKSAAVKTTERLK